MRRTFRRELSCAGKRVYASWATAMHAARPINHESDESLEPYRCDFGKHYHIAHRPKAFRKPREAA